MSEDKKLRIGIIGIGNIGSAHTQAICEDKIPHTVLSALCDIDEEKCADLKKKHPDIPVFCNSDDLIASGLCDAVIVSTPHYFHPTISIKAFKAGLHVLSEKPAAVDINSALEMEKTAEETGRVYGVMFNQRANRLFSEAKRIVSSGQLGELKRSIWIITNWYRKQCYYDSSDWRATWWGEGGGVLINQAPHNLDLWQWICGMPTSLRAECPAGKFHTIEVEDEATLFAEYENGATGVFITTTGDYPGTNRLEITGTRGKLILENKKLTLYTLSMDERKYCLTESNVKNSTEIRIIEDVPYNGHCEILKNFASAVLFGTPLLAPGMDAKYELSLSNAAYLSSWTGEKITFPIDGDRFVSLLEERKKHSIHKKSLHDETSDSTYISRWNTNW